MTGGSVTEDPRERNERLWEEALEKQREEQLEKITPQTYEKMNEEFIESDEAFRIVVPTQEAIDKWKENSGVYHDYDYPTPDLVAEHWKEHNRREALKNADKDVEAPEGEIDKHGFTIRPRITDSECIIICLQNAPCGIDRKQAERLIKKYTGIQYD